METFFNPRLMFSFSRLQMGVGNANLIKAEFQPPTFNIATQLANIFSRIKLSIMAHG